MAFAVSDLEQFLDILRAHPEWRACVRTEVVGEELLSLPDLVRDLVEAQRRTEARVEELAVQVRDLAVHVSNLTVQIESLGRQMNNLAGRVGNLEGGEYEARWARNAPSRVGLHFRRARVVWLTDVPELDAALGDGRLSPDDWKDLGALDVLIPGHDRNVPDAPLTYAAIELSMTVDERDVARAARRADLIRRAGVDARPFVGGHSIRADAADLAERLQVTVFIDREEAA